MLMSSVCNNKGDTSNMSLAQDGLKAKIKPYLAQISVTLKHPLILLANELPWDRLAEIVIDDLKNTTSKGFWWAGRRLYLRIHLAIYILQARTKKTDREIIAEIHDNAPYQAFCGVTLIKGWKCPHPTKIEEFRSRLSPETKMRINVAIIKIAVDKNFADLSILDVDSTVQEANIAYPTDANMLLKLAKKCSKVATALNAGVTVNMKKIGGLSKNYFFRGKCSAEEANHRLLKYYNAVKSEILPVIDYVENRVLNGSLRLKWSLKNTLLTIATCGRQYIKDAGYYVKFHKARKRKALSLHAKEVACISKGKTSKKHEFGRVFQLGRIGGNFLVALCSGINLSDKKVIKPMLEKHEELFGPDSIDSLATDRGYYSVKNMISAKKHGVKQVGIQKPGPVAQGDEDQEELRNRRSGIEPLIGHAKKFGLGKSKMKVDKNTHGSGFTSIMGFNLSQLERNLTQERVKIAG